eukprot:COSAG01_NODE_35878_length_525_cov_1.208920_1_plen_168_part_10
MVGVRQMGVVSRMAAIEAATPSAAHLREAGDFIAYVGRVPVKVRGQAVPDGWAVPSGLDDGTAVVISDGRRPTCCLGRVVQVSEPASSTSTSDSGRGFELKPLGQPEDLQMVEISVIGPGLAVNSSSMKRKCRCRALALLILAALCICVAVLAHHWLSVQQSPPHAA